MRAGLQYPIQIPDYCNGEVLAAAAGQLIELVALHENWGFGAPLVSGPCSIPVPGARGVGGSFCLDWVCGIGLKPGDGESTYIQVEHVNPATLRNLVIRSLPCPRDARGRLQANLQQRRLERAKLLWSVAIAPAGSAAKRQALQHLHHHDISIKHRLDELRSSRVLREPSASHQNMHPGSPKKGDLPLKLICVLSKEEDFEACLTDEQIELTCLQSHGREQGAVGKRFARSLLDAKRSGELHALSKQWQAAQRAVASSASGVHALKARFSTAAMRDLQKSDLQCMAGDLASEVERRADEFQQLKERALRSLLRMKKAGELERLAKRMPRDGPADQRPAKQRALHSLLEMKRSGELERLAQEMADVQEMLKVKAAQIRQIAGPPETGTSDLDGHVSCNADRKYSGELERLVGEVEQVLENKAETLQERVRKGLLRAHRTGELQELRGQLDELADTVPRQGSSGGSRQPDYEGALPGSCGMRKGSTAGDHSAHSSSPSKSQWTSKAKSSQNWPEPAASSDSEFDNQAAASDRNWTARQDGRQRQSSTQVGERRRREREALLKAKRSGELHQLLKEWEATQKAMASSVTDLQSLKERFKAVVLGAHRTGELHRLASELASEVEKRAIEFNRLKERALQSLLSMKRAGELERIAQEMERGGPARVEPAKQRVLRSLLEMKRSGELERLAQEMADMQANLEAKAAQLREIAQPAQAECQHSLARIAGQISQVLETKAPKMRERARNGLIRALRAGELQELCGELDELADAVPMLEGNEATAVKPPRRTITKKRWAEMTTSSDSDFDPKAVAASRTAANAGWQSDSVSEGETQEKT